MVVIMHIALKNLWQLWQILWECNWTNQWRT